MNKESRDDLDRLDALRDLAQSGPERQRGESQQAYEELRSRLLEHDWCQGCDDDSITEELNTESKNTESPKRFETDKAVVQDRESNEVQDE